MPEVNRLLQQVKRLNEFDRNKTMKTNPSQILTALETKAHMSGMSLPAVAETWIKTDKGPLRLALCHSLYGWHWEVGSYRASAFVPVRVLGGEQKWQVQAWLAVFLRAEAIN